MTCSEAVDKLTHPLPPPHPPRYDGEFQVIPGFADAVSAARVARRAFLDEADAIATDDDRWSIYRGKTAALERLHAARRRTPRRVS